MERSGSVTREFMVSNSRIFDLEDKVTRFH